MNNCSSYRLLRRISLISVVVASLMIAQASKVKANTKSFYLAQTPQLPRDTNIDRLPQTPLPDREKKPRIKPLPPIEELLDIPATDPSPSTVPSEAAFKVKFKLEGNTVLEAAEVEEILKDYRDRSVTFADLLELETKFTKLYTSKGYVNSAVVVPSQNVDRGVVTLQAIEGSIDEIKINVDGRLKEGYIRSRLGRGTKSPFNINELQSALQILQLNPLIESINTELSVGSSRDRWKLNVDVKQAKAFDPVLFVDNNRNPSVGSIQRGLELNHNNVLGYADKFSFIFKNTEGSNDFDTSYTIPINSLDGTVGLRYRHVDSDIIEGNFESLDIESQTDEWQLTVRQPLLVRANSESTQEFALGLEFSRQSNDVSLENRPFPSLSPGADADGETKISALRFFQDWTRRTRKDVLAARSQLSTGLDVFDATVGVQEPDSKFVSWRGQVQWLRQLKSDSNINLFLRSDLQLSSDDLVPLERFSLGGAESVRGYRQDVLLGDNGLLMSGEVRIPVYRWNQQQSSLTAIPFLDFGTSWSNSDNPNQPEDTVASLGIGVQLDLSNSLTARLDYGIPLIEVKDTNDTLQENGLYFSLEYFPF